MKYIKTYENMVKYDYELMTRLNYQLNIFFNTTNKKYVEEALSKVSRPWEEYEFFVEISAQHHETEKISNIKLLNTLLSNLKINRFIDNRYSKNDRWSINFELKIDQAQKLLEELEKFISANKYNL